MNITSVTLVNGATTNSGVVSTLDQVIAVGVPISSGLPVGANTIGSVTLATGANTVGTFNVGSLPVGANTIGAVLGVAIQGSQSPTVTAATYAASVCMGGIITFTGVLPNIATFSALLESITVSFKGSVQTVGFWVAVFYASPAGTFTDHSTAAIAANDTTLLLGLYHLTTPSSVLGTHTMYNLDGIGKAIAGTSTSLFVVIVPDGTTTSLGSTSDLRVELGLLWG